MLSRVIEQLRMTCHLLPDLGYRPVAVFAAFTGGNRTHRPGRVIRIDSGAEAVGCGSRLPLGRGRYGIAGPTTKRAVPRLSRSSSSACRATRHTVGMRQRLGGRTQSPCLHIRRRPHWLTELVCSLRRDRPCFDKPISFRPSDGVGTRSAQGSTAAERLEVFRHLSDCA